MKAKCRFCGQTTKVFFNVADTPFTYRHKQPNKDWCAMDYYPADVVDTQGNDISWEEALDRYRYQNDKEITQ